MTEPKTITDLREKIAELSAEIESPTRLNNARLATLFGMEQALRWALGEEVDHDDLTARIPMRWRRQEDNSYVSVPGYRVHEQYLGNWYAERAEGEPLPGWNTATTLAGAKTMCENDWHTQLRKEPEL